MAGEFIGVEIAVVVVIASITLAGILIGLGRAFSYKRIEHFGIEELIQSVINAAIIGAFAAIIELVNAVATSVVAETCVAGDAIAQLICTLESVNNSIFGMFTQLIRMTELLGYYQSLALDFTSFTISPFSNLAGLSNMFMGQMFSLQMLLVLLDLNVQILYFIAQNALLLLFPLGLVLRTLFATRKVGGFLIALSLGLYILYPSFVLIFPDPQPDIQNATISMEAFNNNTLYATKPVIDLNDNYAIAGKMDLMSGRCFGEGLENDSGCLSLAASYDGEPPDFSGELTVITQQNSYAMSKVLLYSVFAPLFSLLITIVFVKEVGMLLGSEIGLASITAV